MAPLAEAAGRVGAGELDFAVGNTNVREVNDVLAAMDAMRTSLAESLEARWAAERGQREQVASLAHDLKTPLTGSPCCAPTPTSWRRSWKTRKTPTSRPPRAT